LSPGIRKQGSTGKVVVAGRSGAAKMAVGAVAKTGGKREIALRFFARR